MTRSPRTPSLVVVAGILLGCVLATIWLVILGITMYLSFRGPHWILALSLSFLVVVIGLIWATFYRLSFIRDEIKESDPRIYVAIKEPEDATARRRFTLTNHGGGAAHNVRIATLTVCGRRVEFPQIAVIPVGESREISPKVVSKYPEVAGKNDLFHWMEQDWSTTRGNVMAEWPVHLTVVYDDYTGTRNIKTTMMLVFYPLQYRLQQQGGLSPVDNPVHEFRNITFNLVNGMDESEY